MTYIETSTLDKVFQTHLKMSYSEALDNEYGCAIMSDDGHAWLSPSLVITILQEVLNDIGTEIINDSEDELECA